MENKGRERKRSKRFTPPDAVIRPNFAISAATGSDRFEVTSAQRLLEGFLDDGKRKFPNFEVIATDSLTLGGDDGPPFVDAERAVYSFTDSDSDDEIIVAVSIIGVKEVGNIGGDVAVYGISYQATSSEYHSTLVSPLITHHHI